MRLGDADVDGFPDILAVAVREGNIDRVPILLFSIPGKDAGVSKVKRYLHSLEQETMQQLQEFGHRDTRNITEAGAVRSTAAAKSLRRTFRSVKHGADALSEITDARSVAFLDLDEDVSFGLQHFKRVSAHFIQPVGHFRHLSPTKRSTDWLSRDVCSE